MTKQSKTSVWIKPFKLSFIYKVALRQLKVNPNREKEKYDQPSA